MEGHMSGNDRGASSVVFSAVSHEGLQVRTSDGRQARLAVVDDDGHVLAAGEEIASAAFEASVRSYRAFLIGTGHIRVLAKPVGLQKPAA